MEDQRPSFSPIPVPAILRPRPKSPGSQSPLFRPPSNHVTIPADDEQGLPLSPSHMRESRDVSPYEAYSRRTWEEEQEEEEEEETATQQEVVEDTETLEFVTAVVKTVMELSNRLPHAKPNDYVELVKVR